MCSKPGTYYRSRRRNAVKSVSGSCPTTTGPGTVVEVPVRIIYMMPALTMKTEVAPAPLSVCSQSKATNMGEALANLEPGLASVMTCIASSVADISAILRQQDSDMDSKAGTTNDFGDAQLQVDCAVDELIFDRLSACPACCAASSEEQPDMKELQGSGYTVVFDPLDGSSIVGANFSVGSIFGVWPGSGVVGRTGRQQAAAVYAVYGPRTMLTWARPTSGNAGPMVVEQWALCSKGTWQLLQRCCGSVTDGGDHGDSVAGGSQPYASAPAGPGQCSSTAASTASLIAPSKNVFAPANLRCAAQNTSYRQLIDAWIQRGFTLRYTGGMVPDVHHILAKGGGVFVNPSSAAAPAKLRLVYECAPLALIVEAAGGASHDGYRSILDVPINSTAARSPIVLGSPLLVEECKAAMTAQA